MRASLQEWLTQIVSVVVNWALSWHRQADAPSAQAAPEAQGHDCTGDTAAPCRPPLFDLRSGARVQQRHEANTPTSAPFEVSLVQQKFPNPGGKLSCMRRWRNQICVRFGQVVECLQIRVWPDSAASSCSYMNLRGVARLPSNITCDHFRGVRHPRGVHTSGVATLPFLPYLVNLEIKGYNINTVSMREQLSWQHCTIWTNLRSLRLTTVHFGNDLGLSAVAKLF